MLPGARPQKLEEPTSDQTSQKPSAQGPARTQQGPSAGSGGQSRDAVGPRDRGQPHTISSQHPLLQVPCPSTQTPWAPPGARGRPRVPRGDPGCQRETPGVTGRPGWAALGEGVLRAAFCPPAPAGGPSLSPWPGRGALRALGLSRTSFQDRKDGASCAQTCRALGKSGCAAGAAPEPELLSYWLSSSSRDPLGTRQGHTWSRSPFGSPCSKASGHDPTDLTCPARRTDEETEAPRGPGTCVCPQTGPACLLGTEDAGPEQPTCAGKAWEGGTPLRPDGAGVQVDTRGGGRVRPAGLRPAASQAAGLGGSGWGTSDPPPPQAAQGLGLRPGPSGMPSGCGSGDPGEGRFGQSEGLDRCPWVHGD